MKYIIVKAAVYDHGVMWIGENLSEGKIKADYFASNHDDGHHEYQLRIFREPIKYGSGKRIFDWTDECELIYTGIKS